MSPGSRPNGRLSFPASRMTAPTRKITPPTTSRSFPKSVIAISELPLRHDRGLHTKLHVAGIGAVVHFPPARRRIPIGKVQPYPLLEFGMDVFRQPRAIIEFCPFLTDNASRFVETP